MNSSSSTVGTLIGLVLFYAVFAGYTGVLAAKKNRNVLAWVVLGGIIFPGTGLLVLLFMSYLCPKCQKAVSYDEWKRQDCPRCRSIRPEQKAIYVPDPQDEAVRDLLRARFQVSEGKDFLECPSCRAMIPPGETKCPKCGWS